MKPEGNCASEPATACEWCGRAIAQNTGGRWYAVKGEERGYDPLTCDASDDGRHDAVEPVSAMTPPDEVASAPTRPDSANGCV